MPDNIPLATQHSKGSSKLSTFLFYTILAYIISIYIKNAPVVSNALMFLLLLQAILSISGSHIKEQLLKNKVYIGMLLFFLLELVSVLLSNDKSSGFNILSLRLPLLVMPLAFCFIEFEPRRWTTILLFYATVTTLASLIGFGYGTYMAIHENNTAYYYNDNISDLLFGKQAAYFGLYVNAAIIIFIYLLDKSESGFEKYRIIMWLSILWLLFISYMLASKMSIISLIIILFAIGFLRIFRNKKILEGTILIMALVIGMVLLYKLFPKTVERFKTITQTNYKFDNTNAENSLDDKFDANKWSSGSTRMALWKCGKEVFSAHPIAGTGLGDIRSILKDKYKEKNFIYALNTNKNLHCQFFDVAVSMGIIGLLVFLITYFYYPLKTFVKEQNDIGIAIFACIGLCLLTENMFDRYQGEQIIAFLLPLVSKFSEPVSVL